MEESMMRNENMGFGIFLIIIGAVLLLTELNVISLSISSLMSTFFKFWPLILIVIGINIIFHGNRVVSTITWLAFVVVLILLDVYGGRLNFNIDWGGKNVFFRTHDLFPETMKNKGFIDSISFYILK
jgi:hypothetical protein